MVPIAAARVDGGYKSGDKRYPLGWNDLIAIPCTARKHELAKLEQIAR